MDLRLPRTEDSTYSPHPDATPPSPPPADHVPPENLTANDRVASYKPAHRRAPSHSTKRGRHVPLHPANMTSSVQSLKEDMASAEESYDFLDSSGVLVPSDDDGAETVSSGSFALLGPNLDETRSVNGDELDDAASDEEGETPEPVFQPSDSGITTRPDIRTPEASTLSEKPREIVDEKEIHIIQPVVRSYDSQWAGMSGNSMDELKYSVAKERLDWTGSFRILFAGFPFSMPNDTSSPEHLITEKLAAALGVGQPESRTAKTYTTGVRMSSFGSEVMIKEIFNHDDQTSDMFTESIPTTLPNLVVMCNQSMDLIRLEDESLLGLRAVMDDRGVPILNISFSNPAGGYFSFSPNRKSLRICLKSGEEEIAVVPVDLNTFLNLDDAQLNGHLACIGVGSTEEKDGLDEEFEEDKKGKKLWFKKSADRVHHAVRTQPAWFFLVVGLLLSAVVSTMVGSSFFPGSVQNGVVEKADQAAALTSALQAFTGAKTDVSVIQRDSGPNATAGSAAKSRSDEVSSKDTATKSVSIFEHPFSPRANDSENFKLHIIGDYHFVLTPPKHWASLRRAPKLLIRIQRGSEEVPFESEKLVDGVHAIRLDRKNAYGSLNVTISTRSKPKMEQNLEVDFGSPWLKMSSWAGRVKTDVAVAQISAKNTSVALFRGMQVYRDSGKNITDVVLHSATQKALQLFNKTMLASNQLRDGYRSKQQDLANSIATAAKQLDLAKPIQRARRNAARLARKLGEKTKSLRSKVQDKGEEKTKGKGRSKKERPCGKKAKP